MDKKRQDLFFAILHKIVIVIAVVFFSMFVMDAISNGKLYDNTAEDILSTYRNRRSALFHVTKLTDNSVLESSVVLFSGNRTIGKVTATDKTTLQLGSKQLSGEGKLLIEHKGNGEITTVLLTENSIVLEEGEYHVFLSGKRFSGKVALTADTAHGVSLDNADAESLRSKK